jgi:hypothetical protein
MAAMPVLKPLHDTAGLRRLVASAYLAVRAWFDSFGIDPGAEPPYVFAALVRAEYAQMGEVIGAMGIKAE